MKTPTIFQLGKLENLIEEINEGTGSTHTFVSKSKYALSVSLTLPELTNDIQDINQTSEKLITYFGLSKENVRVSVIPNSSRTSILIKTMNGEIEIKAVKQ